MGLRPRRRNLVVWSQSAGPHWAPPDAQLARPGRIRRWFRLGLVLGLLPLARAVRARWMPLLAGTVLTAAGYVLRANEALGLLLILAGQAAAGRERRVPAMGRR